MLHRYKMFHFLEALIYLTYKQLLYKLVIGSVTVPRCSTFILLDQVNAGVRGALEALISQQAVAIAPRYTST